MATSKSDVQSSIQGAAPGTSQHIQTSYTEAIQDVECSNAAQRTLDFRYANPENFMVNIATVIFKYKNKNDAQNAKPLEMSFTSPSGSGKDASDLSGHAERMALAQIIAKAVKADVDLFSGMDQENLIKKIRGTMQGLVTKDDFMPFQKALESLQSIVMYTERQPCTFTTTKDGKQGCQSLLAEVLGNAKYKIFYSVSIDQSSQNARKDLEEQARAAYKKSIEFEEQDQILRDNLDLVDYEENVDWAKIMDATLRRGSTQWAAGMGPPLDEASASSSSFHGNPTQHSLSSSSSSSLSTAPLSTSPTPTSSSSSSVMPSSSNSSSSTGSLSSLSSSNTAVDGAAKGAGKRKAPASPTGSASSHFKEEPSKNKDPGGDGSGGPLASPPLSPRPPSPPLLSLSSQTQENSNSAGFFTGLLTACVKGVSKVFSGAQTKFSPTERSLKAVHFHPPMSPISSCPSIQSSQLANIIGNLEGQAQDASPLRGPKKDGSAHPPVLLALQHQQQRTATQRLDDARKHAEENTEKQHATQQEGNNRSSPSKR